jgi:uncharacterized protein YndB with AHSA1/START domain
MGEHVEQHVDLDTDLDEAWRVISDGDELATWFGGEVDLDVRPGGVGTIVDDAGVRYDVLVTAVEEGRRVAWHWWNDRGELSSVEISLAPTDGLTRIRIVERLVGPVAPVVTSACARRWERASARLWSRVVAHAAAW